MKLVLLTASNIFSIGDIELKLSDRGLLLITGHSYDEGSANGAGKSSIANKAISWGLYGQTFNGVKADAVVNQRDPESKAYVRVDFLGVDGKSYSIYRQRNPAKLTLHQEKTNLTQRSQEDTQAIINKALGKDFKTFSHTDFFGQGRTESFFSLPPADQKEIIENILPMDKLSEWTENCKKARSKLNALLAEVKEKKIKSEAYLKALYQQNTSLKNNSINWQAQHEIKSKGARESIEKSRLNVTESLSKTAAVEAELKTVIVPTNKNILQNELTIWKEKIEALTVNLNECEKHITEYKTKISFLEPQLKQLKFDGVCTTCFQTVSPEVTKKKQEEILTDIVDAEFHRDIFIVDRELRKKQIEEFKEELVDKACALDVINEYEIKISGLKNKLAILNGNQHQQMLDVYEENLKAIERETNPHEGMLKSITNQIAENILTSIGIESKLEFIEKEIAIVRLWEDGYAYDIKNMMIEQACPFLEDRTNQYMKDLNNPQIRSTFSTVKLLKSGESRDEFSATVKSSTGGQEFDLFSGGEQQLTSFACGMALADLASSQAEGSSELLILDEPFMGLSAMNCENVINFLTQTIGARKSTILLISNEEELKSLIPQSIHVVKRGGISHIEA